LKHMNKGKKKKQEVLEEVLQTKMTIKEDNVMYVQHNREHEGRGYGHSRDQGNRNNNKERGQTNQQNWCGQGRGRGRGDRSNCPNVECYDCGDVENMGITQEIAMPRRE